MTRRQRWNFIIIRTFELLGSDSSCYKYSLQVKPLQSSEKPRLANEPKAIGWLNFQEPGNLQATGRCWNLINAASMESVDAKVGRLRSGRWPRFVVRPSSYSWLSDGFASFLIMRSYLCLLWKVCRTMKRPNLEKQALMIGLKFFCSLK